MENDRKDTLFAAPEREAAECTDAAAARLADREDLRWLERVPFMVFLANACRQIVYCNPNFLKVLTSSGRDSVVGMRPGEALGCVHASEMPGGCGCSASCRYCGAARAILKSLQGQEDCQECHLLIQDEHGVRALDIQILTKPFTENGQRYCLSTAIDVSHERRVRAMSRSIEHSMINAAGGMDIVLSLMNADGGEELLTQVPLLRRCAQTMLQDVLYQHDVHAADLGQMAVTIAPCALHEVVLRLVALLHTYPVAKNRTLSVEGADVTLVTDVRLLRHVLHALFINALEAVGAGDVVRIGWLVDEHGVTLHVDNAGVIPPPIALQLFSRYVSSKGRDRGLGLHMAKVFTENYLGGTLSYVPLSGQTRFALFLPHPG